jgi:diguanylate cyclase (GGDEF)-like protein
MDIASRAATIAIDSMAIAILVTIFVYSLRRSFRYAKGTLHFDISLLATIAILTLDILIACFDGQPGDNNKMTMLILTIFYYLLIPVIPLFWICYVAELGNVKKNLLFYIFILTPLLLHTILTIMSPFFDLFFSITAGNEYARGSFVLLSASLPYVYALGSIVIIIIHHKNFSPSQIAALSSLVLLPLIGSILQFTVTKISLSYGLASISFLYIFLFSVLRGSDLDSLTGLQNRKQFEDYFHYLLEVRKFNKKKYIIGVMLDINKFKSINDKFGHQVGDEALRYSASLLLSAVGYKGYVARYAGDEFVIIIYTNKKEDEQKVVQSVREKENEYNSKGKPYTIHFAIGSQLFDTSIPLDSSTFFEDIDKQMYDNKRNFNLQKK